MSPFTLVMGVVIGLLAAGLFVPYVRTEAVTTRAASHEEADGSLLVPDGDNNGDVTDTVPGATGDTSTAGSGSSVTRSGGGGGTATPSGGGSSSATEVGVTANSIKLGIAIIDVGAAKSFGFNFDLGDQKGRYDALVAAQNAKGGINGRKIIPDYRTIDAANPDDSGHQACVAWTKDSKVFAVLGESQISQATAVCVIGEGNTPLISTDGFDQSYYANGLYFSTQANDNRILADHANYLAKSGLLNGKKIGVLTGEGSERLAIDKTLVPTLARLGFKVTDIEEVPGGTSGTQKLPIAVSNFKAAGVDYVIVAANVILAGPFVQSADRAGYHPGFGLSDFNNEINDQVADYYPDSFEGTIGLSTHRFPEYRAGKPPPPADQHCFDRVAKADPKIVPYQNSAHEVGLGECAIFDTFVNGAIAAGAGLTRPRFVAGVESLTSFGIPSTQDGSFGPGKHDAVDYERRVAWHKDCTCWRLVDDQVFKMTS